MVTLVHLVTQVNLALPVNQERVDPRDQLELLDLWDQTDQVDQMVNLAPRALLDQQVNQDHKVKRET